MPPNTAIEAAGRPEASAHDWLVGGGAMGEYIRSMDWSRTALGPIDAWPQSLRTTVSLCLASNFPISIAWGPKHAQIYNDGYWPICGGKHPRAMGQDFSVCWASAWPAIGDAFSRALQGETSYLENVQMFLDRNGYLEETFFTFSFSPIRDESGGVGGLFHPVTETTARMLAERRARALRDLTARCVHAQSTREVFELAAQTLAELPLDLPFVLLYVVERDSQQASLIASLGLQPNTEASPTTIELRAQEPFGAWPIADVVHSNQACVLDDVATRLGELPCGPYPEPPKQAYLLPVTLPGANRAAGVIVAGVSSRLQHNDTYRAFYESIAVVITAATARAHAYEEERRRAQALAEIDRAKTAFFSNVSHEFRTPLTLILGPLEDELATRVDPLPPDRKQRLEAAHRNAMRMLRLVNTLLDFSRIEAGRIDANMVETDLAQRTIELASVFRSATERAGLELTVDCPPLPEPILVDPEMWEKIVLNLISNAFKHTFEGEISVALRARGDYVALTVTDTGVGIAPEECPRIFDRFHRVRGARSRTHEGTGIGLALVRELVLLHGGTIEVASKLREGTTFTVKLKRGREHLPRERTASGGLSSTATSAEVYVEEAMQWLPEPAATIAPIAPPSAAEPALGRVALGSKRAVAGDAKRARILWADDNADMREYVGRLLSQRYDVVAVHDGATALAEALKQPPDLVLTDVMMPGLDGFGLLAALRAEARTRTIPIILLSARAGEEAAVEGLSAGADDYLSKPFTARDLLARVRTHLELARMRRDWADQLERANKELEAFSYSVSHDLRAPLRAIDGFSKALLVSHASQLDDEAKNYLDRVRAATTRMSVLIDDLLDLSRISRGELRVEAIDLTALARSITDELARESAHVMKVEIEEGLRTRGDARLVAVALQNLLSNAWKFSSKKTDAHVMVGWSPEHEAFFVRDNGAGFDMAYVDNLFRPFQRLHSQSEFEGSGIGLATVQRVVNRHRGRLWAEGVVGGGATFYFTVERD